MPLPTGTTRPGASGLTRSEAAILAWKKRARAAPKPGALDPKIAARVKEILAGKQKKGKAAPKGKAKAAPKGTPQEIANKNRAAVAKQGGMDKLEGVMVRLGAGMHSDLEKGAHDELIKKGLAKRGADGTVTLSPAGKKWKSAADKGDVEGAGAALAAGQAGAGDAAAKETAKGEKAAAHETAKAERVAGQQAKQAEKQKKLKQAAGKAKAKAAAKPAPKPADAPAKQAANRAKVAKDMADQDSGLSPSGSAALGDFADGKPLDEKTATQFESMGLTEKGSDGAHRLTADGKAAAQAMSKGDTRGALDAISRAADKKKTKAAPTKAWGGFAIKQTAQERAMFASMDDKATRKTPKGEHGGSSSGGGGASGGGPGGRATLRAPVSGDMEAHARFVTQKRTAIDARAKQRAKAKKNIAKIDAIQRELKKRTTPIARLRELQQQLSDIRSGKALDMNDETDDLLAIKAGARHSAGDMKHIQAAHDSTVSAGASCAPPDDAAPVNEAATAAIKGIMDNPAWYAQHECGDVMQACSALSTLTMLIQSELGEEDEDIKAISQLVDAARTLVTFIDGELDELEGAAGDAAEMPNSSSVTQMKAVDATPHLSGGAIKAIGDNDEIGGYAVLFGSADTHDMERDYYTKATNFWLDDFGWPRPITYHHGMDAGTRDHPVIGHWTKAAVDDTGVWLSGQLDRAHAYYKAIKELAQRGYLKLSSDSAPQWVQRERQSNGANYIKRWPLITASATVTPMEPRMFPVEVKAFLAELGYEAIDTDSPEAVNPESARPDGVKADDARARRLTLELSLMELEETAQ